MSKPVREYAIEILQERANAYLGCAGSMYNGGIVGEELNRCARSIALHTSENIEYDTLVTAFSGLSVLIRMSCIDEIGRAVRDTAMEYHKAEDRGVQIKLAAEVEALNIVYRALRQADDEFKECSGSNAQVHSVGTTREGLGVSSDVGSSTTSSDDNRDGTRRVHDAGGESSSTLSEDRD